ncbi:hypothetical protein HYDPIDRAFT_112881 [Hydnomerulius pinastri MD-312]|uniref:Uncharacterized protein n=1 Tax=Hydnomerulius pinastri MD-312 TaxID=994086 RepID=A0A0C9W7Y4_9AGAM|nr:hypothetical protein HYDPIDRAFT_112881 [Hydnomerulius pinastri MD-312]
MPHSPPVIPLPPMHEVIKVKPHQTPSGAPAAKVAQPQSIGIRKMWKMATALRGKSEDQRPVELPERSTDSGEAVTILPGIAHYRDVAAPDLDARPQPDPWVGETRGPGYYTTHSVVDWPETPTRTHVLPNAGAEDTASQHEYRWVGCCGVQVYVRRSKRRK